MIVMGRTGPGAGGSGDGSLVNTDQVTAVFDTTGRLRGVFGRCRDAGLGRHR
jgi:hypothetical protein